MNMIGIRKKKQFLWEGKRTGVVKLCISKRFLEITTPKSLFWDVVQADELFNIFREISGTEL